MKRIRDPFPPTPADFHLRVERTLEGLEDNNMNKKRMINKTLLLAAALIAVLLATGVASVIGQSRLKNALNMNGAEEVADLVQEVHAGTFDDDLTFSIDEIIWEGTDLFMTCTIAVPEDGNYIVAMYTPTLNGEKLVYDAKGWTLPKFIDQAEPRALLYGEANPTTSTELLTFAVDPAMRQWHNARFSFRAALLKTGTDHPGETDFGGLLKPPVSMAVKGQGVEALTASGAEVIAEREIDMTLDAASLPQKVYNDVEQHDYTLDDVHIHIDRFRMGHTGISIEYTVWGDGLEAFMESPEHLSFGTIDGRALGLTLGVNASGGNIVLEDGTPAWRVSVDTSALIPLNGLEQIVYAPTEYPEDADGRQLPPVYDLSRALTLTPVYSEAAESVPPEVEDEPFC